MTQPVSQFIHEYLAAYCYIFKILASIHHFTFCYIFANGLFILVSGKSVFRKFPLFLSIIISVQKKYSLPSVKENSKHMTLSVGNFQEFLNINFQFLRTAEMFLETISRRELCVLIEKHNCISKLDEGTYLSLAFGGFINSYFFNGDFK